MHSLNVNSTALHLFIGRFSPLFLVFICYFDLANPHKPHKKLASKRERERKGESRLYQFVCSQHEPMYCMFLPKLSYVLCTHIKAVKQYEIISMELE